MPIIKLKNLKTLTNGYPGWFSSNFMYFNEINEICKESLKLRPVENRYYEEVKIRKGVN